MLQLTGLASYAPHPATSDPGEPKPWHWMRGRSRPWVRARRAAPRSGRAPAARVPAHASAFADAGVRDKIAFVDVRAKFGMGENGMLSLPAPPPT